VTHNTADYQHIPGLRIAAANEHRGGITVWRVEIRGGKEQVQQRIATIGVTPNGERSRHLERLHDSLFDLEATDASCFAPFLRLELVRTVVPDMIHRDLAHAGLLPLT
jgi:hypothetical protein